jgi:hypothetical protein
MANNSSGGGIGLMGALGIVFIVLKLVGTINWSWWLVLAPFWGPFSLVVVLAVIAGICYAFISIFK